MYKKVILKSIDHSQSVKISKNIFNNYNVYGLKS